MLQPAPISVGDHHQENVEVVHDNSEEDTQGEEEVKEGLTVKGIKILLLLLHTYMHYILQ